MNEKSMTYLQNFAEFAVLRTNFASGVLLLKIMELQLLRRLLGRAYYKDCFLYIAIILNVIPITQRRTTRMQEPRPAQTWKYPFGIAALVFYLTEPLGEHTVDDICYHIRRLAIDPVDSTSYFLLLFPEGTSVLLFCPQRAICSGFGQGDLSPVLARARQKITETVLKLIKDA